MTGKAGTEVVDRELAANIAEGADKVRCFHQIGYGACLGDLKAQFAGADTEFGNLLQQIVEKRIVGDTGARQIDGQAGH